MSGRIYGQGLAESSLGQPSTWPHCLKSAVDLMLAAKAQIVLFWGGEFIALYNDAYAPTIGTKHPRALGRPARENWGELWSDLEPLLRRVLNFGETVVARDRPFYIERHGYPETVHFDISYSPIRDETGKVRGVFCIVNETTERVRSEAALRDSEERFRAIFTQTAAGIGQSDLAGRLHLVNRRFCEIVGYSEAELLKMRVQDITFPNDLDDYVHSFRRMLETGQSFDIEKRYVRKDGSLVWVANSVSPLRNEHGNIRQAVAVVVDITERKRAQEVERRLAAIIASSNDAILGTDLNMRITSWNSGAEKLYGYSADEAIGRSVMILVPDDRIEEEPAIIRQVSAGLRVDPYETKRRRSDGKLVDVLLSVSPIFDAYGRTIGASKIAHDISARKEAERLQTVLVGELNHRVKNVLATVMAIARQTLGRETANRAGVDAFEARIALMSRAHDLLMHGNWEQAELESVVKEALSPYARERFSISGPSIRLVPRAVVSISLALHELATNAAKYGALSVPEGQISVHWSIANDDPQQLTLRWQETGGPKVNEPARKGFGSRLIENLLAAELKGDVTITYDPAGVICEVNAVIDDGWDRERSFQPQQ
ncbi:PAS domain S-box protein [Rhizobium grahamii]|uniref:Blue-light-activated histidine kinase n=1 Tax=Rhizobium grahamii TaxID=1120045 RepID=A0A370KIX7_9HYPH|nr:PAS domain S-box protein [Rhizobium grahamii]RDJ05844.1 histidine kinase [Rhizobium grahamii]